MKKSLQIIHKIWKLSLTPILMILTFVYAMLQGGFVSWFLFYSFLPFGLYALLLPLLALQSVEVTRTTNQRNYEAGERFSASITIKRKIPFPLFYIVVEDIVPLTNKTAKTILFPGLKRQISFQYDLGLLPRGEHIFSSIRLTTGDLFGLAEKEVTLTILDKFLVYPQYVDMVYRQLESRFEQGTTSTIINIERDSTVSVGVRDYKPGDRFSWIDWKASARKNSMMTKEFEQQQNHNVLIFMDRSASPMFEPLVTFTASLVRAILKKGAYAAFYSIGKERTVFPLQSGDLQQQQIFYHLAKVQADAAVPFSRIIEGEFTTPTPAVIMLVTGSLSMHTEKAADSITKKHGKLLIFVVKEKVIQLSKQELHILEALRRKNIVVKPVYEGHYTNVFFEVNKL
ncbi:DUF58 domain-containing protein [Bacillus sp. 165]|uniref:DUF58 domain-containing protein n=1 Tax=Bacillus sp. 165 TaxID=1529117 RepID=UPI001ADA50E4|nr:DUF58 domain-containing protein [Bacillus sp. 165]MBO9128980.1 DUF58 domain-containing protein [Bacillus sp. 165]